MKIRMFLPPFAASALMPALALAQGAGEAARIDSGDTAWMLVATALVAFMILPGIALFYGGLVRARNVLSILAQTAIIACAVMVIWVVYGYSMAFGGVDSPFWGALASCSWPGSPPTPCRAAFPNMCSSPSR